MFFASKLNSGIPYQTSPSGGNMSMMKTLGLIHFLPHRASIPINGFADARHSINEAARNWLIAVSGRMLRRCGGSTKSKQRGRCTCIPKSWKAAALCIFAGPIPVYFRRVRDTAIVCTVHGATWKLNQTEIYEIGPIATAVCSDT